MTALKPILVSTDGSCLSNPGPCAWGWIKHNHPNLKYTEPFQDSGGAHLGTNNIGELSAILEAIKSNPGPEPLGIEADSEYSINCVTKWLPGWKARGWKTAAKQPIKNLELVVEIDRLISEREGSVQFKWVKAHDVNEYNNAVDALAYETAQSWRAPSKQGIGKMPPEAEIAIQALLNEPTATPSETKPQTLI